MLAPTIQSHIEAVLDHLYVTPLERCNLCCKICYTVKSSDILTPEAILDFVSRYQKVHRLSSITFCGGEVMLLRVFPNLVNKLTDQGLFIQVITNGTADRLAEFTTPNSVNIIVSLDGLPEYHDKNRGAGNFEKSLTFLKKAQSLGFHLEVYSIATHENIPLIPAFEALLTKELGALPDITYHPRKPMTYLENHPISNQVGTIAGFDFPQKAQVKSLAENKAVFPPRSLGCYELSLMSDGSVNACCEGIRALGDIHSNPQDLIDGLYTRLEEWAAKHPNSPTLGCVEPDFLCGLSDPPYTR